MVGWGDVPIPRFTLALFHRLNPDLRLARLGQHEQAKYGAKIVPGGPWHARYQTFMDWTAQGRHRRVHQAEAEGPVQLG